MGVYIIKVKTNCRAWATCAISFTPRQEFVIRLVPGGQEFDSGFSENFEFHRGLTLQ